MARPQTLLEGLCGHALSFGSGSIEIELKDGRMEVYAKIEGAAVSIARYALSSADGKELLENLQTARKKPLRTILGGSVCILKVRAHEAEGEDALEVLIELAPKLSPSVAPSFTAKNKVNIWLSSTTTR